MNIVIYGVKKHVCGECGGDFNNKAYIIDFKNSLEVRLCKKCIDLLKEKLNEYINEKRLT